MIIADGRRGHEVDTRGSNNSASTLRTTSNPQDVYSESLLGKLVLTPTTRDTIRFTAETVQRRVSTDVLSAISRRPRSASRPTTGSSATASASTTISATTHSAGSRPRTCSSTGREAGPVRVRDARPGGFAFARQPVQGAHVRRRVRRKRLRDRPVRAQAALRRRRQRVARDEPARRHGAGRRRGVPEQGVPRHRLHAVRRVRAGPDRLRPPARHAGPALRHVPAGSTANDPLFTGKAVSTSANELSRVAVLYEITPAVIPYVQYAHGFRAPTPDQVNSSFEPGVRLHVDRQSEPEARDERHVRSRPARQGRHRLRRRATAPPRSRAATATSSRARRSPAAAGQPTRSCSST